MAQGWTSRCACTPLHCTADGSDVLEHAAYLGMAAMLNGPLFTADVRNPEVGSRHGWGGVEALVAGSLCAPPCSPKRLG